MIRTITAGLMATSLLCSVAFAQVLAPEDPPTLDPLAALDQAQQPLVVMRGTISDSDGVEVTQTDVVMGVADREPADQQQFHSKQAVLIELLDPSNRVVRAVALDDPRVVHELEGSGATYLVDEAEFAVAVPLEAGAPTARISQVELPENAQRNSEALSQAPEAVVRRARAPGAEVDLTNALQAFCSAHPDEDVCAE